MIPTAKVTWFTRKPLVPDMSACQPMCHQVSFFSLIQVIAIADIISIDSLSKNGNQPWYQTSCLYQASFECRILDVSLWL